MENNFLTDDFNLLIKTAKEKIANIENLKKSQIIIVMSGKNNLFYEIIDYTLTDAYLKGNKLINELKENEDTEVRKILCMWNDGCIELPSIYFRKLLCELNEKNKYSEILLNGKDSLFVSKINRIMI